MKDPYNILPNLSFHLTQDDKEIISKELKRYSSFTSIGKLLGKSRECISREVHRGGGILNYTPTPPSPYARTPFSHDERKKIEEGCKRRLSYAKIAALIGKSSTGVRTEITKNGGKEKYNADQATHEAMARRMNMQQAGREPLTTVEKDKILQYWESGFSPPEIASKIRRRTPLIISYLNEKGIFIEDKSKPSLLKRIEVLEMQVEILYDTLKEKL